MADPFIGEIKAVGFAFAPRNWTICKGQLMEINQNGSLFSLLGTNYGGDGRVTFGIADLRGRTVTGQGQPPGQANRVIGQLGGRQNITLQTAQLPPHKHTLSASSKEGTTHIPTNAVLATGSGSSSVTVSIPEGIPVSGEVISGPATLKLEKGKTSDSKTASGSVTTQAYAAANSLTPMSENAIGNTGGGAYIGVEQPYLTLNYIMALDGIYPSRN
ncbi:phage tail protein [Shewanella sp. KX20019]|uniref:phage tail protein n=1 Tax=Shewanella sp. KX20019 TaxID=2803864 RepID=UPI00192666CD|nr:tail fiber protein [Shewanella sp. KX20019]QQX78945.1 phage tail protein [Shewanella sp. KX20019]